jgi:NADPH:quinone reductase-like Zn-dependent oxidoreductase
MTAFHIDPGHAGHELKLRPHEAARPGPHEVLVRVHAAAVNYRDLLILGGRYPIPARPGVVALSDGAGEVVAVGAGVTRVAAGDRVCSSYFPQWTAGPLSMDLAGDQFGCTRDGWLAQEVLVPAQAAVPVPAHLSFEQAATLPCAAVTAWSALTGPRPVRAGETVLTMGTGGVALFALQFARLFGARVLAITSTPAKAEVLRRLGADTVIDYGQTPQWEQAVRKATGGLGVDHIVETGSIETLPKSLACTAANGQVALVAALGASAGALDARALSGLVTVRRVFVGSRASFEAMNRALALHRVQPVIDRVFPFAQARAAYEHFAARRHIGKLVISIH